MKEKLRAFMIGRYGPDSYGRFLSMVALISIIIFNFTGKSFFYLFGTITLFYSLYRMLSKNHGKRIAENRIYYEKTNTVRGKVLKMKRRLKDKKTHHIYKCPNCSQKVRVPRGKGNIEITCPKCRTKFVRKS